ncbi:SUKH-3 domain-containing protein [Nocardia sp. NPDC059240]|uniref:SUKH-3 domain-containing protein n=1 Tax=Nocardia sp. NPDC059240 TaxID=3346786 RepID=UPI0036AA8BE9
MRFFWPNPITTQVVTAAGWTPARRIDISMWVDRLEGEGYEVTAAAAAILEGFGNLALHVPETPDAGLHAETLFFDPVDVGSGMYERYADLELSIGHRMTPLAVNSAGTAFLLILDNGAVVSDGPRGLHLLGSTFPQALDLAIRRHRSPIAMLTYNHTRPRRPVRV